MGLRHAESLEELSQNARREKCDNKMYEPELRGDADLPPPRFLFTN